MVSSRWSFSRVLVVLVFVAALVGGAFWAYRHFYAASNNTADVTTTAVSRGDIDVLVSATGVLEPSNFVDVGAQVSGLLDVIHVRVGEHISKDQLLAEIDPTIYLARVDANRAQLKNQQAQLAMLQVQLEQTASTLRAEEANLDYARIYSTMEGTVVSITARQGQTLNTSQQAPVLMRIADLSSMKVRAQVSEANVGKLAPGDRVYSPLWANLESRFMASLTTSNPLPK